MPWHLFIGWWLFGLGMLNLLLSMFDREMAARHCLLAGILFALGIIIIYLP